VGLLTGNIITRETLYTPAVQLALIPFIRPELYPAETSETEDQR
jgi:non-canonical (house-cleaning) NTP pyrophosphatase